MLAVDAFMVVEISDLFLYSRWEKFDLSASLCFHHSLLEWI